MRILIVNTFYYPNMQGGAEQSVKLLAENLLSRGHEVAVYCADSKDRKKTVENINGITVYRCTTGKFNLYKYSYKKSSVGALEKITQKLRCYYNPECEKDFEEICDKFKPEIIHTNTLYGIPCSVWRIAHKKGIKVVHTIRDTAILSPVQHGHKVSPLVVKAHQKYMCGVSEYVDAVTAPSEYTLRTSLDTGAFANSKVKECVFNSVSIDYALLRKMVAERKARTSEHIKFMYAGRLIYLKGIRQMIEAFSKIANPDCELYICGTGDMVEYVNQQAEKDHRIIYRGKLTSEELAKKYQECDVLLFPSVWPEPFGRVFIEGNMYGLPVIAGDCGGIPEIYAVTHGGDLCDCEDVDALAERMQQYLKRDYINRFYESIENNIGTFDIKRQISSFEKIYDKIGNR
jgi:glycosyltransferase involved in cell wall biosynthesis